MIPYSEFEANLLLVHARILRACEACGRSPETVALLPVTKNHPVEAVDFVVRGGLTAVGENRVQEASEKRSSYSGRVQWELIGHLQEIIIKLLHVMDVIISM